MKGGIKVLSKVIIIALVFAQTTAAETGLALPGIANDLNEPLYLTLCGIGLLVLGMKTKNSI